MLLLYTCVKIGGMKCVGFFIKLATPLEAQKPPNADLRLGRLCANYFTNNWPTVS